MELRITTISKKAHSGVLHYLRSNRSSKLCRNAFDRLRISDMRLFPALQILTLEVSLDPSKDRNDGINLTSKFISMFLTSSFQ